jgi:hypothetical protein
MLGVVIGVYLGIAIAFKDFNIDRGIKRWSEETVDRIFKRL